MPLRVPKVGAVVGQVPCSRAPKSAHPAVSKGRHDERIVLGQAHDGARPRTSPPGGPGTPLLHYGGLPLPPASPAGLRRPPSRRRPRRRCHGFATARPERGALPRTQTAWALKNRIRHSPRGALSQRRLTEARLERRDRTLQGGVCHPLELRARHLTADGGEARGEAEVVGTHPVRVRLGIRDRRPPVRKLRALRVRRAPVVELVSRRARRQRRRGRG